MGQPIDRDRFAPEEYRRFAERLEHGLEALGLLLARPGFGAGPPTVGAEVELCIVDGNAAPHPVNARVLAGTADPRLDHELNRFNLELNLPPVPLAGRPFARLGVEMDDALAAARRAAAPHRGRIAAIGILPTLTPEDLQFSAMSDVSRYRALADGLRRERRGPFQIHIHGPEPLVTETEEITYEGACTSLQVHLRVQPEEFGALYNAAQMATGPALAAAGNSPTFLGHRLWRETRVALFKQAVDARSGGGGPHPGRVSFGRRWLRGGVTDLFAAGVHGHPPLLPICSTEDPLACVTAGGTPQLSELRLHSGTVWRWNRPVYEPGDGGHLRIEMRALPAGPTSRDMAANAAFLVGLTLGLAGDPAATPARFPYAWFHGNFYRAAQSGLEARVRWPDPGGAVRQLGAAELLPELVAVARRGLEDAGVKPAEVDEQLEVIAGRIRTGQTGAVWQVRQLAALEPRHGRAAALREVVERYLALADTGQPVHTWPVG
ncbi:MAG: hypothetical protein P1P84_16940 [Deferrisomatales bacterium]|nr:hypothetical protein [Deferrisomatales bacterium]